MAATAGRARLLLLLLARTPAGGGGGGGGSSGTSSNAGVAASGCFPGLGRHRQQRHRTAHQRLPPWQTMRVVYCSTVVPSDDVTVVYQNGLPVISVNLPSRRERCQFTLKPISDSVGVFLQQLQAEDRGIDRVAIYSPDGTRVASSTGIDLLLLDDFKLVINDLTYHVRPPKRDLLSHEDATTLNDVKTLVQQLYTTLCIEEHQLNKEKELIGRLEDLKQQLAPLEKQARMEICRKAEKRTTWVLWGGLAYMATQFGILARLTWWEYSWDIMEPVTYFITYGSAMAMYAYFVVTRQVRNDVHFVQFIGTSLEIILNIVPSAILLITCKTERMHRVLLNLHAYGFIFCIYLWAILFYCHLHAALYFAGFSPLSTDAKCVAVIIYVCNSMTAFFLPVT